MVTIIDISTDHLVNYTLQMADNSMILGQRLGEWCGHGPILEQDIAMTNIALDLIGEARSLYQYVAEIEGGGKTEDDYPFKRDVREWKNLLLVELPNEDFAYTIVRQSLFDIYHYHLLKGLQASKDDRLAAIAAKSIKEVTYHLKYSSEWMVRLGDGTEESKARMQKALNDRIRYFDEALIPTEVDTIAADLGIGVKLESIKDSCHKMLAEICERATLELPEVPYPQKGGKTGMHTEHMGYILADLQYLQKTYPNSQW